MEDVTEGQPRVALIQFPGSNCEWESQRAAEAAPEDPRIHYQLGMVMDRLGRSVDAVDSYRRADKLHART